MFITLYSCRVRPGQGETLRSLYQEWEELVRNWNGLSTELLSNNEDPRDLILVARFRDEDAAWSAAESPGHRAWYAQLARLTEVGPIVSQYQKI